MLFGAGTKGEVRVAAAETLRALQFVLLPPSNHNSPMSERRKGSDSSSSSGSSGSGSGSSESKEKERDKLLWTWCKDVSQQEEIKRLTTVSL